MAFLVRYNGRTLEAYRQDLRYFFAWPNSVGLVVLTATRPHIELFRHHMEQRGWQRRRSIGRLLFTADAAGANAKLRPARRLHRRSLRRWSLNRHFC